MRSRALRMMAAAGALAVICAFTSSQAAAASATLQVRPTFIGAPGDGPHCSRPNPIANTWVCHVTVSETSGSSMPLQWSATSVSGRTSFSPSHGTLAPGNSTKVKITTHLCAGYFKFKFAGPQNTVVVTYTCG